MFCFIKEWEIMVCCIGWWVDFVNDYKIMDVFFMEMVWWVFWWFWDDDLIYEGFWV